VTNELGELVAYSDYYPFGLEMPKRSLAGDDATKEGFTGHELDAETGLNYAGARYYDPEIGRWLAVDPLKELYPAHSPYVYVLNNPLILVDPDGKRSTHVDSTGKVIAVYDDGDLGVYQHSDLGDGDAAAVDERRAESGTTHGGGKYKGYTASWCTFTTNCDSSNPIAAGRIDFTGSVDMAGVVDHYWEMLMSLTTSGRVGQMLLIYFDDAGQGQLFDIKTGRMAQRLGMYFGSYYGNDGLIVNFRDAGNILAGRVAANAGRASGTVLYAYGEFARTDSKPQTALNTVRQGHRIPVSTGMAHYRRHEDERSWRAAMIGWRGR
jgi:RHS repeat-associated protein